VKRTASARVAPEPAVNVTAASPSGSWYVPIECHDPPVAHWSTGTVTPPTVYVASALQIVFPGDQTSTW
jgi:hypothetical protein